MQGYQLNYLSNRRGELLRVREAFENYFFQFGVESITKHYNPIEKSLIELNTELESLEKAVSSCSKTLRNQDKERKVQELQKQLDEVKRREV